MPVSGSAAAPPQLLPPSSPGISIASRLALGGVKTPSLRALRNSSRKRAFSAPSTYGFRSSTLNLSREKGGGFVGNGCVGDDSSPGTSLFGTARSSIGQRGSPVTRSKQ